MTTVCPQLRIVAALAGGIILGHRPSASSVLHFALGTPTPSGHWIARGGRTVICHPSSRRLEIVQGHPPALDLGGRRFCRSGVAALPPVYGYDGPLVSRDHWAAAFAGLTVELLLQAAAWTGRRAGASPEEWAAAVEETHQIGYVASVVLGYQAAAPVEDVLIPRRNRFRTRALTDEQRAANAAVREAEAHNAALMAAGRRRDAQLARAADRKRRGQYLMPHERELLSSSA